LSGIVKLLLTNETMNPLATLKLLRMVKLLLTNETMNSLATLAVVRNGQVVTY